MKFRDTIKLPADNGLYQDYTLDLTDKTKRTALAYYLITNKVCLMFTRDQISRINFNGVLNGMPVEYHNFESTDDRSLDMASSDYELTIHSTMDELRVYHDGSTIMKCKFNKGYDKTLVSTVVTAATIDDPERSDFNGIEIFETLLGELEYNDINIPPMTAFDRYVEIDYSDGSGVLVLPETKPETNNFIVPSKNAFELTEQLRDLVITDKCGTSTVGEFKHREIVDSITGRRTQIVYMEIEEK